MEARAHRQERIGPRLDQLIEVAPEHPAGAGAAGARHAVDRLDQAVRFPLGARVELALVGYGVPVHVTGTSGGFNDVGYAVAVANPRPRNPVPSSQAVAAGSPGSMGSS
jgi:hypothetical protein